MSEVLNHECSVAALYWMDKAHAPEGAASRSIVDGNVAPQIQQMLGEMQNRGQLAAGIATYNTTRTQILDVFKNTGTVNEVFRTSRKRKFLDILDTYAGRAGIGHTRYATSGQDDPRYAQPFERSHGRLWKWFCFAFNGTLANYPQLRDQLLSKSQYHIVLDNDTEIIMHFLSRMLQGEVAPDLFKVMERIAGDFDGAYNIVFIDGMGRMFASRDPIGIRPLCWSVQGRLFGVASESLALQNLGFTEIHHFNPGEMVVVDKDGFRLGQYAPSPKKASCFFEWIYFANAASVIDDQSVYLCREKCGAILAEEEDIRWDENSIVVPVPDTAKSAAGGYSYRANIPFMEGLLRNRYAGRTFIQSDDTRAYAVRSKYWIIPSVLRGKKVFLVDDSIVRSTTLRALVKRLREEGQVAELHVRIACPPVLAPCYYGVDMSTISELFAPKYFPPGTPLKPTKEILDAMAKEIGVDSLRFMPLDRIAESVGLPEEELCLGCVNRQYPTPKGEELYQIAMSGDGASFRDNCHCAELSD
ncbi:MAG: amidophosphoribosyltransferase [Planctomycetia bacterium]|nr:amidophosphoribosyltransferase [Planctomycetia bacterium]